MDVNHTCINRGFHSGNCNTSHFAPQRGIECLLGCKVKDAQAKSESHLISAYKKDESYRAPFHVLHCKKAEPCQNELPCDPKSLLERERARYVILKREMQKLEHERLERDDLFHLGLGKIRYAKNREKEAAARELLLKAGQKQTKLALMHREMAYHREEQCKRAALRLSSVYTRRQAILQQRITGYQIIQSGKQAKHATLKNEIQLQAQEIKAHLAQQSEELRELQSLGLKRQGVRISEIVKGEQHDFGMRSVVHNHARHNLPRRKFQDSRTYSVVRHQLHTGDVLFGRIKSGIKRIMKERQIKHSL